MRLNTDLFHFFFFFVFEILVCVLVGLTGLSSNIVAFPGFESGTVSVTVNGSGLSSVDAVKLIDASALTTSSNCNTANRSSNVMGSVIMSSSGKSPLVVSRFPHASPHAVVCALHSGFISFSPSGPATLVVCVQFGGVGDFFPVPGMLTVAGAVGMQPSVIVPNVAAATTIAVLCRPL